MRFIVQGRRRASLRMNRILTSRIRMQKNEWYTVTNASPLKGKRDEKKISLFKYATGITVSAR